LSQPAPNKRPEQTPQAIAKWPPNARHGPFSLNEIGS
jgi:hypothetical protein